MPFRPELEHRGEPATPPVPEITQPVAYHLDDPSRGNFAARLRAVEDHSFGTLPTRLALELAQSSLADHQINRASRLLAREFDLSPWQMFASYGAPAAQQFVDPVTGGPMSFATARRFLRPHEIGIARTLIRNAMRAGVPTADYTGQLPLDPSRLRQTFAAMAPVSGEQTPFMSAFGAAVAIASDSDVDLDLFGRNLEVTSRFQALAPELQIAAAHQAAIRNKAIQNPADIATALLPELAPDIARGQEDLAYRRPTDLTARVTPRPPLVGEARMGAELGQKVVAGISGPGDWLKVLEDAQSDYVAAAKDLEQGVHLPFPHSWAGKILGGTLEGLNRGVGAVTRLVVAVPEAFHQETPEVAGVQPGGRYEITDATLDAWDILWGRTTDAKELEKKGYPGWATGLTELALGFYLDPVQIGFNSWSAFKGARLLGGVRTGVSVQKLAEDFRVARIGRQLGRGRGAEALFASDWRQRKAALIVAGYAEDGQAAEHIARSEAWLSGRARRIGDLRGVSVPEYLVREMDRVKNPELFFDRAVGKLRQTFQVGSPIDHFTASELWRWNTNARKLGLSETRRVDGVRSVLGAAIGLPVETGSLAHEVEVLSQIKRAQATTTMAEAVGLRPTVRAGQEITALGEVPDEAKQALGVLDDLAADIASGRRFNMLEIPHMNLPGSPQWIDNYLRTSRLAGTEPGRIVRSIMQTNPIRAGAYIALGIEQPDLVRDVERTLIRSKVWSPEQIAKAKLRIGAAVSKNNPTREDDFAKLIGGYVSETFRRKNKTWGAGEELERRVRENIIRRHGESPTQEVFAAHAGSEAARLRQRELVAELAGPIEGEARAAARRELDEIQRTAGMTTLGPTKRLGSEMEAAPFLRSEFNNTVRFLDPVLYDAGMSEVMGSIKKWNRAIRSHFGEVKVTNRAVKVPIRQWTDRVAEDFIFTPFLSVWKPLAVIRPAYILRVVGIEEMARFFATGGLMRRLQSGAHSGPLMRRFGFADDRFISLGYKLGEEAGQRANTVEDALLFLSDRHVPGLKDWRGWSRSDAAEGDALADIVREGGVLDDANRAAAMRLVRTYPSQLKSIGLDAEKLHLRGDAFAAAETARTNQSAIDEGLYRFRVPGMSADEEMVNNVGTIRAVTSTDRHMRDELRRLDSSVWEGKTRTDPGFIEDLHHALARTFGSDELGNRYLRNFGKGWNVDDVTDDAMRWLTEKPEGQSYAKGLMHGAEDFSKADLEYQVRIGTNYLADLTAGRPELAAAAASGHLTVDMLKMIDPADLPLYVHGPLTTEQMTARIGVGKRTRDWFGRWILQEPTNRLTRQPYFKHWYDHMNEALIREAQMTGTQVTEEMLAGFHQTARQFAIGQVKRVMFDFSRTGRFEEMNRFSLVFVQPYLEEPLAWGRILRQNPAFAWHVERLGRAGIESGFIQKDPKTGELVIPASWWVGMAPLLAMATGAHMPGHGPGGGWELSIPLQAFNLFASGTLGVNLGDIAGTDFPLPLPNANPIAQMAMQRMTDWAADHDIAPGVVARLSAWLHQYGEVGPNNLMGLAPVWVRHAIEAAMPGWAQKNTDFLTTHFLQAQQAMGLPPDAEHAKGQAQAYSVIRILQSWLFPGAPRTNFPTIDLENEHAALIDPVNGLGWVEGNKRWMELHSDLRLFTIARTVWNSDDPNDPLRSPVPIPPTRLVAQLLQTKGAREFAKAHPAWVWAIIPDELANGEFDPGSWFGQIAQSDRVPLSGVAFLAAGAAQDGWDAFFALKEGWIAKQEELASLPTGPIGEGDPTYDHEKDLYDARVDHLRQENPSWKTAYDTHTSSGLDPKVLAEAYSLSRNKTFQKTDVGRALGEYLPLYETIKHDLRDENLSTLDSVSADRLGIKKRYEDGVAAIIEAHPQFATAYNLFFDTAFGGEVKTAGEVTRDRIPAEVWDTKITPWWSQYERLRDGPNVAPTPDDRNAAYGALRDYVNDSYSKFTPSQHPLAIWWKATRPDQRESFMVSILGRSYQFYSRFDKQVVLGERSNASTEALWSRYEVLRTQIAAASLSDPNFVAADAYAGLDAWVRLNASKNAVFGAQVEHANTWGYAFEQIRPQLFPGEDAAPQWDAFLDGVRQIQKVATLNELHGPDDRDPQKAMIYRVLQSALLRYVDELKASPGGTAFGAQWDWLEKESGPDQALDYFVPTIYYPLGATH